MAAKVVIILGRKMIPICVEIAVGNFPVCVEMHAHFRYFCHPILRTWTFLKEYGTIEGLWARIQKKLMDISLFQSWKAK